MTAASQTVTDTATKAAKLMPRGGVIAMRAAAVVLVALVPALFWTGLLVGVGALFAVTFETTTLIATSSAIAIFLSAVCAPIMLRDA